MQRYNISDLGCLFSWRILWSLVNKWIFCSPKCSMVEPRICEL